MKRPGVITFIGWLLLIKSAMAAVTALFAFVGLFTDGTDLSSDQLLIVGLVEAGIAVLFLWAGQNLLFGNKNARTFIGVIIRIRLVATVVVMLTHHSGGYLAVSMFGAAIGVIALYALFVDKDSTAYFDGYLPGEGAESTS